MPARDGSRERPFDLRPDAENGPDMLSNANLDAYLALNLRPADWGAILAANRFNEPAPAGTHFVAVTMFATAASSFEGTMDFSDVWCDLTGDKGKIYTPEFISDVEGNLKLLIDQPEVLGGGTLAGDVYYIVDDDDANFRLYCDGIFIIPG